MNEENKTNELSNTEKTIVTFLIALGLPWILAGVLNLFVRSPLFFGITGILLSVYTLGFGYVKNKELQASIGGIFGGQLTGWVIPPGVSWWIPKPFGQSILETSIGDREIDHRRVPDNRQATKVETSDGTQFEVSYYGLYEIVNLRQWRSVEKPEAALEAYMDRCVRWFVGYYPADGDKSITSVREPFSKYLMGDPVPTPLGDRQVPVKEDLLRDLGVKLKSIRVDDVNPPQSIVEAKEATAREATEKQREDQNIDARIGQVQKVRAAFPNITEDEALKMVMAVAKEIKVVHVSGGAGDFTKGATVGATVGKDQT